MGNIQVVSSEQQLLDDKFYKHNKTLQKICNKANDNVLKIITNSKKYGSENMIIKLYTYNDLYYGSYFVVESSDDNNNQSKYFIKSYQVPKKITDEEFLDVLLSSLVNLLDKPEYQVNVINITNFADRKTISVNL